MPASRKRPPPLAAPEVTVTEAARGFSDLVNRVRYRGERFTLTKGGLPVAELRPVGAKRVVTGAELAERLRDLPRLGDRAAASFAADLAEARAHLRDPEARPWD
jgi:prevent-host-death family protein